MHYKFAVAQLCTLALILLLQTSVKPLVITVEKYLYTILLCIVLAKVAKTIDEKDDTLKTKDLMVNRINNGLLNI